MNDRTRGDRAATAPPVIPGRVATRLVTWRPSELKEAEIDRGHRDPAPCVLPAGSAASRRASARWRLQLDGLLQLPLHDHPILVQAIYLIGAALITVYAVVALFGTTSSTISAFLLAIVIFLFGNLVWRVHMELIILLFRIFGSLQEIERRGRGM